MCREIVGGCKHLVQKLYTCMRHDNGRIVDSGLCSCVGDVKRWLLDVRVLRVDRGVCLTISLRRES